MKRRLVKGSFSKWLEEQKASNPRRPVGYNRDSSRCPLLMTYLGEGESRMSREPWPQWADDFLWNIDNFGSDRSRSYPIYPSRALEVLSA